VLAAATGPAVVIAADAASWAVLAISYARVAPLAGRLARARAPLPAPPGPTGTAPAPSTPLPFQVPNRTPQGNSQDSNF